MAAAGDSKQQAAESGAVYPHPPAPLTIPYVASAFVVTPELEAVLAAAEAAYALAHPPRHRAQPISRYLDLEADASDQEDDVVSPPTPSDAAFIDDTTPVSSDSPPPNPYLTPPRNTGYLSPVHDTQNQILPAQPVRMYLPGTHYRCVHCAVISRPNSPAHHPACPVYGNSHN